MNRKALIIVDIQNDFCEGGSLAVKGGRFLSKEVNKIMKNYDLVVATQDSHPENHSSFIDLWPVHCVKGSLGEEFHKDLNMEGINKVIKKGENIEVDSYSGFFDNNKVDKTGLDEYLRENCVVEVDVVGLALDYCVKFTALDAQELGYKTNVILDLTRAVNLSEGDDLVAINDLEEKGVNCLNIEKYLELVSKGN